MKKFLNALMLLLLLTLILFSLHSNLNISAQASIPNYGTQCIHFSLDDLGGTGDRAGIDRCPNKPEDTDAYPPYCLKLPKDLPAVCPDQDHCYDGPRNQRVCPISSVLLDNDSREGPVVIGPTPDLSNPDYCRKGFWWEGKTCPEHKEPWCFRNYRDCLPGFCEGIDVCPNALFCYDFHDGMPTRPGTWCLPKTEVATNKFTPCAHHDDHGVCDEVKISLFNDPVKIDIGTLIRTIFLVVLVLAGGVAVLLIISAGYKILTSRGKPESLQAGREQLTSAIVGLLFLIFSYVIFQLIIVDLLKIPGITN